MVPEAAPLLLRSKKKATAPSSATAATAPIATPAMAPPDRPAALPPPLLSDAGGLVCPEAAVEEVVVAEAVLEGVQETVGTMPAAARVFIVASLALEKQATPKVVPGDV